MENEDNKQDESGVQEVEAVPIEHGRGVDYDYETGTDSDSNESHMPFRMYYNANFMPSCCSGCFLVALVILIAFISNPGEFLKAFLIIGAVAYLSFQVLKFLLISRDKSWLAWLVPPMVLIVIGGIGQLAGHQLISWSDVLIGTLCTYAILSFFVLPTRRR